VADEGQEAAEAGAPLGAVLNLLTDDTDFFPKHMDIQKHFSKLGRFANDVASKAIATIFATLLLAAFPQILSVLSPPISNLLALPLVFTVGQAISILGVALFAVVTIYWAFRFLRRRSRPHKITGEFYSAIWELDPSSGEISGPICKECLLRMEPQWTPTDRYSRGHPLITHFECDNCKSSTSGLPCLESESNVIARVNERFQAEKRREQYAQH
jgi:hypothetical protein